MSATWKPHEDQSSTPDATSTLPDSAFAFNTFRKEPMTDASHVRNAIARFDQVTGVKDEDRAQAFENIKAAAKHFGIEFTARSWHDLGGKPHTPNPSKH
jgi:hypothetical protein